MGFAIAVADAAAVGEAAEVTRVVLGTAEGDAATVAGVAGVALDAA